MYQRKDYLLRLFEEFARMLAKLVGLKLSGKYKEALDLVEHSYKDFFRLDKKQVDECPDGELLQLLSSQDIIEVQQLSALADLLRQEGEIQRLIGNEDEARSKLGKALLLLRYVNETEVHVFSFERNRKIAEIRELLNG